MWGDLSCAACIGLLPDTKEKRLVLDYRACAGHMNWPSPNISHMIERIGALKPKNKGLLAVGTCAGGATSHGLYYLDGNLCMESNPYGIAASRILLSILHATDGFDGARLCHMRRLY